MVFSVRFAIFFIVFAAAQRLRRGGVRGGDVPSSPEAKIFRNVTPNRRESTHFGTFGDEFQETPNKTLKLSKTLEKTLKKADP